MNLIPIATTLAPQLNFLSPSLPADTPAVILASDTPTPQMEIMSCEQLSKANFAEEISVSIYSANSNSVFEPSQYLNRDAFADYYAARSLPGYAIVSQENDIVFKNSNKGYYDGALEGVTELLDPTTISFKFLDNEIAQILEQSYQFDLISSQKILDYYINGQIEIYLPVSGPVTQVSGPIKGTLLGNDIKSNSVFIKSDDGSIKIYPKEGAAFNLSELPPALRTKPTLELKMSDASLTSECEGERVRTTYKTAGITWRADYNLVLSEDETSASLGAWVSILNMTGKTFTDAKLKLIAGDVNQVSSPQPSPYVKYATRDQKIDMVDAGFQEKQLFEYHMYTLPRPTTVNNASLNQLTLFPTANGISVNKELVFQPIKYASYGEKPYTGPDMYPTGPENQNIPIYIKFDNKEDNKLGIPMPKGKVRVFKEQDGTAEFVGEDLIEHTPRNENIGLSIGNSFDVKGSRTVNAFNFNPAATDDQGSMRETVTIEIRNQKETSAQVIVKDIMYRWMNYELTACVPDCGSSTSNGTHEWSVTVESEKSSTVTYTVVYNLGSK